jgi:hypothetical protein
MDSTTLAEFRHRLYETCFTRARDAPECVKPFWTRN